MNKRIRELRKALNLSQKEFSEKIGLKQNAISYMEKDGATVTEQNIKAICSNSALTKSGFVLDMGICFRKVTEKNKSFLISFMNFPPPFKIT